MFVGNLLSGNNSVSAKLSRLSLGFRKSAGFFECVSYKRGLATTNSMMDETELRRSLTSLHSASFAWAVMCCRHDRALAEEVLQSVYLSLLDGKTSFEGKAAFKTWLFAVIRNFARDRVRGRWWSRAVRLDLEGLIELADTSGSVESRLDTNDETIAVRNALTRLPNRQREIIHLVFYEQLSIAESARVMNVSVGSASQHYARAKSNLQKQLSPLDHGPRLPAKLKTNARSL